MAVIYGTIVPATQVRYNFRFVFLLLVYVLLGHVLFTFYWLYECFTGMSRQDYWVAVHEERDVEWRCPSCAPPQFESTRIEELKNKKSYCHMPYLSFIITNKPTNCIVSFYHKWHTKTYLNQHPPSSTRCYLTKSRTTTSVQRSQNLKTWLGPPTG